MHHPDAEVQSALTRLLDALCSWERATGRESVFILREVGGFQLRANSGKPLPDHWTDAEILAALPVGYQETEG